MTHFTTARLAGIIASGCLAMAAIVAPSAALATQPGADAHKVTICHATDSDTNPYVIETVDIASSGYLKAGHSDHTGPVWNDTLKAQHVKWGDIIPAYTYGEFTFEGQNLEDGQAILDNECAIPAADEITETTTETSSADETTSAEETTSEETTAEETTSDETTAETTTVDETSSDTTTDEQPTDDGEVAVDDGFVTPTPDSTPQGAVLGATGRPDMTPPATDTVGATAGTASNGTFQLILLVLAGLSTMVLVLGRVPAARRS